MDGYPQLAQTVLDTTRPRELAEFYRRLLGYSYRPGDEPPADGGPDEPDWLVLRDSAGVSRLAFQEVAELPETTWPRHEVPMQLHLDLTVPDVDELHRQRARAEALGARLLLDRHEDDEEPLFVFADPSGHPFCVFVSRPRGHV
ncbi:VOC family protein [Streptomyces sp. NPDC015131]|uniref:VOC family protein n=1 Tax=Streptomyces sp. NPDC015131 TaxID=3364941 RepID=UPI0036F88E7E